MSSIIFPLILIANEASPVYRLVVVHLLAYVYVTTIYPYRSLSDKRNNICIIHISIKKTLGKMEDAKDYHRFTVFNGDDWCL